MGFALAIFIGCAVSIFFAGRYFFTFSCRHVSYRMNILPLFFSLFLFGFFLRGFGGSSKLSCAGRTLRSRLPHFFSAASFYSFSLGMDVGI